MLLGEGKFGFFIAPFMVLFLFARNLNLLRIARVLCYSCYLFVVVYIAIIGLNPIINPRSQLGKFLQSPDLILQTYELPLQNTGVPVSRLGDIQFAFNLISRSPQSFLIGYGPGRLPQVIFLVQQVCFTKTIVISVGYLLPAN